MTAENKKFLDDNRHFYEQMVKAETLSGLGHATILKMIEVMRAEFQPGYPGDLDCGPCVFNLVKRLYQAYDKWQSEQPVKVAANFPSHKRF